MGKKKEIREKRCAVLTIGCARSSPKLYTFSPSSDAKDRSTARSCPGPEYAGGVGTRVKRLRVQSLGYINTRSQEVGHTLLRQVPLIHERSVSASAGLLQPNMHMRILMYCIAGT